MGNNANVEHAAPAPSDQHQPHKPQAALEAIQAWGRPRRVMLLVMVDRGHRELPIQPDFCGRSVPTRRTETIELRLLDIDGEEGVFLRSVQAEN